MILTIAMVTFVSVEGAAAVEGGIIEGAVIEGGLRGAVKGENVEGGVGEEVRKLFGWNPFRRGQHNSQRKLWYGYGRSRGPSVF